MNRFDKKEHKYYMDEKPIVGISELLGHFGFSNFSNVPKEVLKRAANFGTAVHELLRLYDLGRLGEFDPKLKPSLNAWKKFKSDNCEMLRDSIIEIKTGAKSKAHKYQTALQKILAEENPGDHIEIPLFSKVWRFGGIPDRIHMSGKKIKRRMAVYIDGDKYKIEQHKDKLDETAVKSMLQVYNIQNKEGIL